MVTVRPRRKGSASGKLSRVVQLTPLTTGWGPEVLLCSNLRGQQGIAEQPIHPDLDPDLTLGVDLMSSAPQSGYVPRFRYDRNARNRISAAAIQMLNIPAA